MDKPCRLCGEHAGFTPPRAVIMSRAAGFNAHFEEVLIYRCLNCGAGHSEKYFDDSPKDKQSNLFIYLLTGGIVALLITVITLGVKTS